MKNATSTPKEGNVKPMNNMIISQEAGKRPTQTPPTHHGKLICEAYFTTCLERAKEENHRELVLIGG